MRSRIFYAVTERTLPDAVALHRHTRLGSAYASNHAADPNEIARAGKILSLLQTDVSTGQHSTAPQLNNRAYAVV